MCEYTPDHSTLEDAAINTVDMSQSALSAHANAAAEPNDGYYEQQ
jgi:hypothetical protein